MSFLESALIANLYSETKFVVIYLLAITVTTFIVGKVEITNSSLKSSKSHIFTKEEDMSFLLLNEGQVYKIFKQMVQMIKNLSACWNTF